ncbi:CPBP family intramembrane glutamic endopeptidase [Massilia aerilata]|uniref:CPBP family intramembrane glutamic endopeptidase n=1 Tax=Massilia aerilata TaxID=453817 RepID=A0ABW0S148_9BURK
MLAFLCLIAIFFTKAVFYPMSGPPETLGIAAGVMVIASLFLTRWSIRRRAGEYQWVSSLVILGLYLGTFITFVCAVVPLSQVIEATIAPLAARMTIYAFVQAFGTAALEEVIFREFIQQQLAEKLTARMAVVITTVVFYLMHLTLLPTPLLFGLAAGVLRAYSGNLVASIILHTMTNTIGYIAVSKLALMSEHALDDLTWSQLLMSANSVSLITAAIAAFVILIRKEPTPVPLSYA